MRTPQQTVFFQQSQITSDGFRGNCQFGGKLRDVDLALPSRESDDLVLSFVRIQSATSGRPLSAIRSPAVDSF
jgi:hypothetical protein